MGSLKWLVSSSLILDVRFLRSSHQVLVFVDHVGLFAHLAEGATEEPQITMYEAVYASVVRCNLKSDKQLVVGVMKDVAARGLSLPCTCPS